MLGRDLPKTPPHWPEIPLHYFLSPLSPAPPTRPAKVTHFHIGEDLPIQSDWSSSRKMGPSHPSLISLTYFKWVMESSKLGDLLWWNKLLAVPLASYNVWLLVNNYAITMFSHFITFSIGIYSSHTYTTMYVLLFYLDCFQICTSVNRDTLNLHAHESL